MYAAGVDIETTGLDQASGHRIIELALQLYDLESASLRSRFVQRINPQRPIEAKAQAVHGITFEELAKEPVFETVAPKLSKILSVVSTTGGVFIAHNGEGFDIPFIRGELIRVGQAAPEVKVVDTMLQGRWATPYGKLPNLGELCFACGVEYDPTKAHAADYDVEVMMRCFFSAYRLGFFKIPQ